MSGAQKFTRIMWPTMLRLGWPSYTNEAIFLFHATALVFFKFSGMAAKKVMRSITQTTLPTRHLIHLFPIRFGWLFYTGDDVDHLDIWLHQPAAK